MVMQKVLIVKSYLNDVKTGDKGASRDRDLSKLQDLLDEGWTVINTCPMPSSSAKGEGYETAYFYPTCLVVLEKIKKPLT